MKMDRLTWSGDHAQMNSVTNNTRMLSEAEQWRARDLARVWHPCTQMKEHNHQFPLIPIARGGGAWLEGIDGKRYLDAISSWWTNLFGHCDPRIAAAIAQQASELDHVIYSGFSHQAGTLLAEKLCAIAPAGLNKVFYGENGSAAIEIALKMSYHSHLNRQSSNAAVAQRTRFVALQNGYHGETIGALAISDIPLYRRVYAPLLIEPLFAPSPDAYQALPGESAQQCAERAAQALEKLFAEHNGQIAAMIIEPLVQCAGGMRMYHPHYLHRARQLCNAHGIHLIADEIAVGFGRTGTLFACEQAGIAPDFLCLSKGLTGGSLPLSAVLTTDDVYQAFWDDDRNRAFLHSHSFTGNPISCAAALATLSIFSSEPVIENNRRLAEKMYGLAQAYRDHPNVADVRQTGMIIAFELVADSRSRVPLDNLRQRALAGYRAGLEHGAILRPLGNVLYWMPPYCLDHEGLHVLDHATAIAMAAAVQT